MRRKSNNGRPLRNLIYIETYGCQMNVYDTELVRAILVKSGFILTTDEQEADVVMLNTCAIRENAHRKVYGRVHALHHARVRQRPLVGILGCMATNLRQDLLEDRNLKIDFIAGPDSYKRLPQLIAEASANGQKAFDVTLSEFETYADVYPARTEGVNAWIAVMRGCNNFCTFCVVPYTRGRERSRSVPNIVEEVQRLTDEGFRQVTLLGQNVNSYRHGEDTFADLLTATSRVEGIERIRFTSPHPKDFPARLLDVMMDNPKICKHIHLPLQAGNDRVLDLMNRTYTRREFMDLVEAIRQRMPNIALTTDIIVGFPTETNAEFAETRAVMADVGFDSAFIFKYSERKHTIAARKHPDDVPEAVKTERIIALNELQKSISHRKNMAHIGEVHPVLIEKDSTTRSGNDSQGRTDGNKPVILSDTQLAPGTLVNVRITTATPHVLRGHPVATPR